MHVLFMVIPLTTVKECNIVAITSAGNKNNRALIGQPCQMPLESLKYVDWWPLFETQLSVSQYRMDIHRWKSTPKP